MIKAQAPRRRRAVGVVFLLEWKMGGKIGQLVLMYVINFEVPGGFYYEVSIFGHIFEIV